MILEPVPSADAGREAPDGVPTDGATNGATGSGGDDAALFPVWERPSSAGADWTPPVGPVLCPPVGTAGSEASESAAARPTPGEELTLADQIKYHHFERVDPHGAERVVLRARFKIRADAALVVGVLPPPCAGWGVRVVGDDATVLDRLDHTNAPLESDGRLVAVVTGTDPGDLTPNWLDTADDRTGLIEVIWVQPNGVPRPTLDLVECVDLADALPQPSPAPRSTWHRGIIGG